MFPSLYVIVEWWNHSFFQHSSQCFLWQLSTHYGCMLCLLLHSWEGPTAAINKPAIGLREPPTSGTSSSPRQSGKPLSIMWHTDVNSELPEAMRRRRFISGLISYLIIGEVPELTGSCGVDKMTRRLKRLSNKLNTFLEISDCHVRENRTKHQMREYLSQICC